MDRGDETGPKEVLWVDLPPQLIARLGAAISEPRSSWPGARLVQVESVAELPARARGARVLAGLVGAPEKVVRSLAEQVSGVPLIAVVDGGAQTTSGDRVLTLSADDSIGAFQAVLLLAAQRNGSSHRQLAVARGQSRTLSSLVARIAHDANTPIGIAVTAAAEITEELGQLSAPDADTGEISQYLREAATLLQRNLGRAAELIERLKTLSDRQLRAECVETVALGPVISEVIELFMPVARRRNLAIEFSDEVTADGSLWTGYPGQLSQVILNLLTNAARYAYDDAGGRVTITLRETSEASDKQFQIEIADFGRGIRAEHLPRIFEESFTTGRDGGGTGLGLAIVDTIVTDTFGGSVACSSTPGQGARFRLRVPLCCPRKC